MNHPQRAPSPACASHRKLTALKNEAAVNVQRAFDNIDQSRHLVDVAKQTVALGEQGGRLAAVQLGYGVLVHSKRTEAVADLAKARADLLKAELGYRKSQGRTGGADRTPSALVKLGE